MMRHIISRHRDAAMMLAASAKKARNRVPLAARSRNMAWLASAGSRFALIFS